MLLLYHTTVTIISYILLLCYHIVFCSKALPPPSHVGLNESLGSSLYLGCNLHDIPPYIPLLNHDYLQVSIKTESSCVVPGKHVRQGPHSVEMCLLFQELQCCWDVGSLIVF